MVDGRGRFRGYWGLFGDVTQLPPPERLENIFLQSEIRGEPPLVWFSKEESPQSFSEPRMNRVERTSTRGLGLVGAAVAVASKVVRRRVREWTILNDEI